jgi:hypothetical protein
MSILFGSPVQLLLFLLPSLMLLGSSVLVLLKISWISFFLNHSFQKIKRIPRFFLEAPVVPLQLVEYIVAMDQLSNKSGVDSVFLCFSIPS